MHKLSEKIGLLLKKSRSTLSVAESCTGGNISAKITAVAGCSEYYLGSVTSYANSVKTDILGVPAEIIAEHGAVSSECVEKMAEGVRRLTGSTFSIATSGIAGPGGGSEEKPVGLVWIGFSSQQCTKSFRVLHTGDRESNIETFTTSALEILCKQIEIELNN